MDCVPEGECHVCNKLYKTQRALNRHLSQVHKLKANKLKATVGNLFCPLCETFCVNRLAALRTHLDGCHKIKCVKRNLEFESYMAFHKWKTEEEKETLCFYSLKTSAKMVFNRAHRLYFHCHKSGRFRSTSPQEDGPKGEGTNRAELMCPAMMVATIEVSGEISVIFWETHVGHQVDLKQTIELLCRREGRPSRLAVERRLARRVVRAEKLVREKELAELASKSRAAAAQDPIGGPPDVLGLGRVYLVVMPEGYKRLRLKRRHDLRNLTLIVKRLKGKGNGKGKIRVPTLDLSQIDSNP